MSSCNRESDSFAERLEILRDELSLAVRFDRPSILFAVYASMTIRKEAEAWMRDQIEAMEQGVIDLRVERDRDDIPSLIIDHPQRQRVVFFIADLSRGGGKGKRDAYRALNLRREHFVEHPARMIFWLSRAEAKSLPRYAPDFWAFRHRVVEFFDQPKPIKTYAINMSKSKDIKTAMYWNNLGNRYFALGMWDDALAAYRKAARMDSSRFEIQYNLGTLFSQMERWEEASKALRKALRLKPRHTASLSALTYVTQHAPGGKTLNPIRRSMKAQARTS